MASRALLGPALIGLAAVLWATDAPLRYPALSRMSPVSLVFFEHLFAMAALAAWAFVTRPRLSLIPRRDWLALALIGAGASATATVLFTASFRLVNPSVAILIQKLQPVLVVLLALLFLGERPKPGFYGWAGLALAAGTVLSFPDLNFSFIRKGLDLHSRGVLYSLAAASIWATSTVAGKSLLKRSPASAVTFWRYAFGLASLALFLAFSAARPDPGLLSAGSMLGTLAYLSLVSGLLAMSCYYKGLSRSTASVATFVELLYPITAVVVNTFFLNSPLDPVQAVAATILLFAVTRISLLN
ncbi:MAG: DMT family transporter [Oligoflexia bacterium]|nr:DMT family transporter [Oligoflexia bacterium]